MGTCWNCDTELSLGKEQTHCDSCGEIVYYKCNACKQEFQVEDKTTKKKLEECKMCGYFKCPHCGVCSWSCVRYKWEMKILKMLRPEITQAMFPNLPDKIREIVNFIESEKSSPDRKLCPDRKVPITYAKTKIKNLLAKIEGFRVKDERDREAFLKRIDELTEKEEGVEFTVSETRERGSYGQEYRDAFNLLVCLGKFKIERRPKKTKPEEKYDVFIRCNNPVCPKLARDDLIINVCPACKKQFPLTQEFCMECKPYAKGKHKGEQIKLVKRLSNKDTCQLYRGQFDKVKNG